MYLAGLCVFFLKFASISKFLEILDKGCLGTKGILKQNIKIKIQYLFKRSSSNKIQGV